MRLSKPAKGEKAGHPTRWPMTPATDKEDLEMVGRAQGHLLMTLDVAAE